MEKSVRASLTMNQNPWLGLSDLADLSHADSACKRQHCRPGGGHCAGNAEYRPGLLGLALR